MANKSRNDRCFEALGKQQNRFRLRSKHRWRSLRPSPDHLVGWRGEPPPHSPPPRRLRRLDSERIQPLNHAHLSKPPFITARAYARAVLVHVIVCPSVCHTRGL